MAFAYTNKKGNTYYLHSKVTKLKNGREQRIYFFAKDVRPDTALDEVPSDRVVSESKNGLPVLKKAPTE